MNYSMIVYILGYVLRFTGLFLTLPAICGFIYQEKSGWHFLVVAVIAYLLGHLMNFKKPKNLMLYPREGFVSVALSWMIMSIVGAIPMTTCGDIPDYVDSLFETISGFTTTGASICPDVEVLTHATLFWRCFTHWVGGMGVFVFIMAILPMLGGSNMNLMKAESPGPSVGKLVPHIKDTAKILYGLYIGISIAEFFCLLVFKMPVFDSIVTTFGTVGTGGFGIKGDSIAGYSPQLQIIVTIFMILSGVNYTAFYYIMIGKARDAFRMEEVRAYFAVILISGLIIAGNIYHIYGSIEESLRHSFFQVGSIITTTGFATVNFNNWPDFSKTILVTLMFIGACAGSTGGGMKVSRFIILYRTIKKELSILLHPREVKKITLDRKAVEHEVIRNTNVFLAMYFVILLASVMLVSVDDFGFTTNFTAVVATLNNIGPGLDAVGPSGNFAHFSYFSKFVLMFDMLSGRLELYPVMIMLLPATWRKR